MKNRAPRQTTTKLDLVGESILPTLGSVFFVVFSEEPWRLPAMQVGC